MLDHIGWCENYTAKHIVVIYYSTLSPVALSTSANSILALAISTYSGFCSMPMKEYPAFLSLFSYATAFPVLPLPIKGSNMTEPFGHTRRTRYCIRANGLSVGCILCFGSHHFRRSLGNLSYCSCDSSNDIILLIFDFIFPKS